MADNTDRANLTDAPNALPDAAVEAGARALCKTHGRNPDWPIGIDKHGYHQEPYVKTASSWEWFHKADAKAVLDAAIPEREREIERLRAEHGAMMECVIKVKARVAELEAALRRILEAAVANLPDQPPVTRKAKTHIDEGDHAHPRRD